MTDDRQPHKQSDDSSSKDDMQSRGVPRNEADDPDIERWAAEFDRGAEPFWMQDVRIAQRKIDAQRLELRRENASGPEPEG